MSTLDRIENSIPNKFVPAKAPPFVWPNDEKTKFNYFSYSEKNVSICYVNTVKLGKVELFSLLRF